MGEILLRLLLRGLLFCFCAESLFPGAVLSLRFTHSDMHQVHAPNAAFIHSRRHFQPRSPGQGLDPLP